MRACWMIHSGNAGHLGPKTRQIRTIGLAGDAAGTRRAPSSVDAPSTLNGLGSSVFPNGASVQTIEDNVGADVGGVCSRSDEAAILSELSALTEKASISRVSQWSAIVSAAVMKTGPKSKPCRVFLMTSGELKSNFC